MEASPGHRPIPPVGRPPEHRPGAWPRPLFTHVFRGNPALTWPIYTLRGWLPRLRLAAVPDRRLPRWTSKLVDVALDVLRRIPFDELQRRGWHVQPNSFYWPLNDNAFLERNAALWHDRGLPKDVDWRIGEQLGLLERLDPYLDELADVPLHPDPERVEFVWENNAFGGADAFAYYGIVRELQPRRVIEIGSGWSSLLLARALERNERPCEVTMVEPGADPRLFTALPEDWKLERSLLQHLPLERLEELQAGDVLFFDGTHCVHTASDVTWLFAEVFPRLNDGVWVHLHDIFLPDDYPDRWIYDEGLSWNEQYLLQAFLTHNDRWAVRLANHLLWRLERAAVDATHGADGGSVWLEKLAPPTP